MILKKHSLMKYLATFSMVAFFLQGCVQNVQPALTKDNNISNSVSKRQVEIDLKDISKKVRKKRVNIYKEKKDFEKEAKTLTKRQKKFHRHKRHKYSKKHSLTPKTKHKKRLVIKDTKNDSTFDLDESKLEEIKYYE